MSKGQRHLLGTASRHSHYEFKKRCKYPGCNKRAKYLIEGKYYCKNHWKEI